jgi:hypothetical protein
MRRKATQNDLSASPHCFTSPTSANGDSVPACPPAPAQTRMRPSTPLLSGLARVLDVDDVMEHRAAIGMRGLDNFRWWTQRGDDDGGPCASRRSPCPSSVGHWRCDGSGSPDRARLFSPDSVPCTRRVRFRCASATHRAFRQGALQRPESNVLHKARRCILSNLVLARLQREQSGAQGPVIRMVSPDARRRSSLTTSP